MRPLKDGDAALAGSLTAETNPSRHTPPLSVSLPFNGTCCTRHWDLFFLV